MDRKRIGIAVGILVLCIFGLVFVYNLDSEVSRGNADVVASGDSDTEKELSVPQKVLEEAKRFEETGEGRPLSVIVNVMSDDEFKEACDWATEDCIEMCEGVDDMRCELLCHDAFYSNEPCREWILAELDDVGFLKTISEGYFASTLLEMPEYFVQIGEGHPHRRISDDFFDEVAEWSRGDGDRMMIVRDSQALGVSMQEHGLVMSDVKEFYAAFEPFNDTEFMTDLVILTKDNEIYWMSTPIYEIRKPKDNVLQRLL